VYLVQALLVVTYALLFGWELGGAGYEPAGWMLALFDCADGQGEGQESVVVDPGERL